MLLAEVGGAVRNIKPVLAGILLTCVITLLIHVGPNAHPLVVQLGSEIRSSFLLKDLMVKAETCNPVKHIMFLKTHKCASSTVQNVFLRFGYTHNLTFALGKGINYLGNPLHFMASMLSSFLTPKSGIVDIFALHTRLNIPEHRKVVHADSKWITVVRDPVQLFESLYVYYHMDKMYKIDINDFPKHGFEYLATLPRHGQKFGRNQMVFDMGIKPDPSVVEIHRLIEEINSTFDLVMIAERLDESLILLRQLLCWRLEDVVGFTKNARFNETRKVLTPETKHVLRELNSADELLYNFFVAKHERAVYAFGVDKMKDAVAKLRTLRDQMHEKCILQEVKGKSAMVKYKEYSSIVNNFLLKNTTNEQCSLLTYPELTFVKLVKEKQRTLLSQESKKVEKSIVGPKMP